MLSSFSCRSFVVFALASIVLTHAPSAQATPAATTTTLTMTSGPTAIPPDNSITTGASITLTAKVLAGPTKVTTGQVNFCDSTAPSCSDIHLLGAAQLTIAGTAVFTFFPRAGAHTFKAEFAGTPHATTPYAASKSSASTLTVIGPTPSFIYLTANSSEPPPQRSAAARRTHPPAR
jgi:hypothetical protein